MSTENAAENSAVDSQRSPASPVASEPSSSVSDACSAAPAASACPGAESDPGKRSTEMDFIEALKQVIDPELMVNIVDLGLVYSVTQDGENDRRVLVEMTLTSPACPAGPQIIQQARMALERLADVDEARITLTMTPPWSPDRMTDDAKDQLGIF